MGYLKANRLALAATRARRLTPDGGPPEVSADRIVAPSGEEGKGPVNVLPMEARVRVAAALMDGNSISAVERMTGANHRTITRLLVALGTGAQRLHDRLVRDLECALVQVDEIWSYVMKKQARVTPADGPDVGEAYTFVALDATSRMVLAWRVGKRNQDTADAFIADLRARMAAMPQLTSDGFAPYVPAVDASFGRSIDYMMTVKNYRKGATRGPDHHYEPPRDPFITKHVVFGTPDPKKASTAYMERQNGTNRHMNGRMRRLCLAFSRKIENHRAAVAFTYVAYNFCHVVRTLRVTPAMQLGVTDHVWTIQELIETLLAEQDQGAPVAKPLIHPQPSSPSRAFPNGRGFIRLVSNPMPAQRTPSGTTHPSGPASAPMSEVPRAPEQLPLFPDLGE